MNVISLLYSIAILLSTPLQFFPAVRILEVSVFGTRKSGKNDSKVKWEKNALRGAVLAACCLLAWVGADDLDKVRRCLVTIPLSVAVRLARRLARLRAACAPHCSDAQADATVLRLPGPAAPQDCEEALAARARHCSDRIRRAGVPVLQYANVRPDVRTRLTAQDSHAHDRRTVGPATARQVRARVTLDSCTARMSRREWSSAGRQGMYNISRRVRTRSEAEQTPTLGRFRARAILREALERVELGSDELELVAAVDEVEMAPDRRVLARELGALRPVRVVDQPAVDLARELSMSDLVTHRPSAPARKRPT